MEEGRVWLWRGTVALALVLLVTGVWLSLFYRPPAQKAFNSTTSGPQALHVVHWVSAVLFLAAVVGLAVNTVVARRRSWPAAVGVVVLTLGLVWTGTLLPWDQLALWAVTIGTNIRGFFTAAFDDQVKFVIVGSTEVSRATLRTRFIVHAAVLPVLLTVCLVALRRRSSTVEATTGA